MQVPVLVCKIFHGKKYPQNSIKIKVLPSVDWDKFKEIHNFSFENVKTVRIFT